MARGARPLFWTCNAIMPAPDPSPFGTYAPSALLRGLIRVTQVMPDQWLTRRLAFVLRGIGLWLIGNRPVDWTSIGVRWRLHPQDNVTEKRLLFTPHYFDAEERAYIARLVGPGFVLIDAGANAGGYALSIAAVAPADATIIAIEPQPEMVRRLEGNCALNDFGTVHVAPVALAAERGTVTLSIHRDDLGGTKVSAASDGPVTGKSVDVPAVPMLDIVQDHGLTRIDVLKADVEGYEEAILTHYFTTAPEHLFPRHILLENNRRLWGAAFEPLLASKGYRIVQENRMNIYFERTGA
ncbi:MAG: FkbM family methyltransferase [Beijerinckiaceae bacterium]